MRRHYAHVPGKKNMRFITSQPCPLRRPTQPRLSGLSILWHMEDGDAPPLPQSVTCLPIAGRGRWPYRFCTHLILGILRLWSLAASTRDGWADRARVVEQSDPWLIAGPIFENQW